ncbi:MAG: DUF3465 domain-containing protein [Gemmatimonadetes bacterium]|nr:DUF3465 domain-containing protein [Gemmatimonadota bacterium]
MKKFGPLLVIVVALLVAWSQRASVDAAPARGPRTESTPSSRPAPTESNDVVAAAFAARRSDVQVAGAGVVLRLLSDDNDGSRHQRFILRLADGQTVLVAHNIDLAPRLAAIARGDTVRFNGEYEWNENGGVIHWTHRDPAGRHVAGWLEHDGRKFQ